MIDLSEIVWYALVERSMSCGSGSAGSGRPSLSLTGSPSSIGSGRGRGAVGTVGGGVGVNARFFSGGSPRFLVESRLFSDILIGLDRDQ